MTNEKELREEFRKAFVIDFGDDIKPNLIIHDDIMEIADWWLSKLHSHTKMVVEKIRGMKKEAQTLYSGEKDRWLDGYYAGMDDLLASLEDNKK